jgi:PAS domain S-box-containing protein
MRGAQLINGKFENARAKARKGKLRAITERKRHEEQLIQLAYQLGTREQEFRALAENSPDLVVRYDRDCRFVYANPNFERLLGYRLDELRGKTQTQVPGLPQAEFFEQRVGEVVQTGMADEFEHPLQTADGEFFWGQHNLIPEFDKAGRVAFVQVVTRDISALKDAELYLASSREQLRELAMQWDSEQEEKHKRLAWDVHEGIGQNLMVMLMKLQTLADGVGADGFNLREHAGNMLALVNDTVRLMHEVTIALRPRVLDFGLNLALEWLTREFGTRHGINCAIDHPKTEIPADERVSSLLFRVAEEALSHIARRGGAAQVNLRLEWLGDSCRLTVRERRQESAALPADRESLGLAWILEQIAATGGEIVKFVAPGEGMVIEANLPMPAA